MSTKLQAGGFVPRVFFFFLVSRFQCIETSSVKLLGGYVPSHPNSYERLINANDAHAREADTAFVEQSAAATESSRQQAAQLVDCVVQFRL
jgi:hypothetical protein